MKKAVKFNGVSYNLYAPFDAKYPVELIDESLECGVDFFVGSSAYSVAVYMVRKENVEKFVEQVEQTISFVEENFSEDDCLDLSDTISLYEEPVCFAVLHQKLDNSEYDFFVTGFDVEREIGDSGVILNDVLSKLSDFSVIAGSSRGDMDLTQYVYSFGDDGFDVQTGEYEE